MTKYLVLLFIIIGLNSVNAQSDILNSLVKTLPSQYGVYKAVFSTPQDIKKVDKWMNKNGYKILSKNIGEFVRFGDINEGYTSIEFIAMENLDYYYYSIKKENYDRMYSDYQKYLAEVERQKNDPFYGNEWLKDLVHIGAGLTVIYQAGKYLFKGLDFSSSSNSIQYSTSCKCTNPKLVENNDLLGSQNNYKIEFDNSFRSSNIKIENGKYLYYTGLGLSPDYYDSYTKLLDDVTTSCKRSLCKN